MLTPEARSRIARNQEALVRSLVLGKEAPEGMDRQHVAAARLSLLRKRAGAVSKTYPQLAAALGTEFFASFAGYADQNGQPSEGGSLADGHAFAHYLRQRGQLPETARAELLWVDLHWKRYPSGLRRRRGFFLRLMRHTGRGGFVLALRLPLLGAFWLSRKR